MVRQLGAGLYSKLPLGQRVMNRVASIVREEMSSIGGQEFHHPALHPAELWKQSGRWEGIGEEMFRLQDRKHAELCLGMTHEEVFSWIAQNDLGSYKQLPQIWYQIQTKFRDEARPKSGVLRSREFTMKDSYSFDVDAAGLDASFDRHAEAYRRIFARAGVEIMEVEASSGAMGGSASVEFMARSPAGEDWVVSCAKCGYGANLEKAQSTVAAVQDDEGSRPTEVFDTPGVRTIEDLVTFEGGATADRQIKTLVLIVDDVPTLFLLRGDHSLNEVKVAEVTGTTSFRPAQPDECKALLGAMPGSLGAICVQGTPIYADDALQGRSGMTTGANVDDKHIRNVDVARDIPDAKWASLRDAAAGDGCVSCGAPLQIDKAIEVGHIFKLGTKYSEAMNATVLNKDGKRIPLVMGSYGIGLERIVAASIEQHHDDKGIVWPVALAPFAVVICVLDKPGTECAQAGETLYEQLQAAGVEVLLDDRPERAGVKLADAELVGFPVRLAIGRRSLKEGMVEMTRRGDEADAALVPMGEVLDLLR